MKRSDFIKSLGLGSTGLVLPSSAFIKHQPSKIYDNYIKGLTHYEFQKIQHKIKEGDALILRRDLENEHDTFAIEVYFNQYKLGYITAYENIVLANMLDNGVELKAYASQVDLKTAVYRAIAIEIFADLIIPTQQFIELLALEKRSDDATDIYRQGY